MIQYNYVLRRDEKDEVKQYLPVLPSRLENLVCVEGPNSSGKSTLMHIIALGLHGLKNPRIEQSLRDKLQDLVEADHQKLVFSFEISDNDGNPVLSSEKKDFDQSQIDLYEFKSGKKKPLCFEAFERKYRLIYDIPKNPLGRLPELAYELKDHQTVLGKKIQELLLSIRDTLQEVQNARNPKRIQEFTKDISEKENELKKSIKMNSNLEQELDQLCRYDHCLCLLKINDELLENKIELDELLKNKKENRKNSKKVDKEVQQFIRDLEVHKEAMRRLFADIIYDIRQANIKTEDDYLALWSQKSIEELIKTEESRLRFFGGLREIYNAAKDLCKKTESEGSLTEANLINELVGLLEHYSSTDIIIPGVEEPVKGFINILRKRAKNHEEIVTKNKFYIKIWREIEDILGVSRNYVNTLLPKVKDYTDLLTEHVQYNGDTYDKDLSELETNKKSLLKKQEYHTAQLAKLDIKSLELDSELLALKADSCLKPYLLCDEKERREKISELRVEKDNLSKKIDTEKNLIQRWKIELERLENKKPHPLQENQDVLNILLSVIQRLQQKVVSEFDSNICWLIDSKRSEKKMKEQDIRYCDNVATYLAGKIGMIKHVDNTYKVTKLDLLSRKVFTQEGKVMTFTDFGTGQSQSAYLRGLLKVNDGRKVIALLDEVAMMDESSMKPIYDLLKEQEKDGQLLAAVVVQKGENIKVHKI